MLVFRILGWAFLLGFAVIAALVYDAGWNEGRLLAMLLGRDRLVAACLPAVRSQLTDRGFTPTDVEVGDPVSISLASGSFGGERVLAGRFTFSDGANGPRVDGRLVCRVHGNDVHADVNVDGLPLRAA